MGTSAGAKSELHFESPPVQQVTLGAYFKPIVTLGVLQFVPILEQWRTLYPQLNELPHVHSWRPFTDAERAEAVGRPIVTPMFELQSGDGQRTINVQHDRLVLTWRFEAEGSDKEYAGYASLKEELEQRLSELAISLKDIAGFEVTLERADATYQNLVDMPARDFFVGMLTSWSSDKATFDVPSAYSGMRLAGLADRDDDDIATVVAIEDGPDGVGTDFTIDVERTVKEGEEYLDALDDAHQIVLDIFVQVSGGNLMETWGRR